MDYRIKLSPRGGDSGVDIEAVWKLGINNRQCGQKNLKSERLMYYNIAKRHPIGVLQYHA